MDQTKLGAAIGKFIASGLQSRLPVEGAEQLTAVFHAGLFEVEMGRSERVAEAIDRTIKRLMQVKAAKQMLRGMTKQTRR